MKRLAVYIIIFFMSWSLPGLDREFLLGKADNWQDIIRFEHTITREGKWGLQDIVLTDAQQPPSASTELLLSFDRPAEEDTSGGYRLKGGPQLISHRNFMFGGGSGAFQGRTTPLECIPRFPEASLFSPGTLWDDFSVEFWLYPLSLGNGETLLSWNGTFLAGEELRPQTFLCTLKDRKVRWQFTNFFFAPGGEETEISLVSLVSLLPERWSHHLLRFDSSRGLLEYQVDGRPEAIVYATADRREGSSVYLPYIGEVAAENLHVGKYFSGLLDELRLSRSFVQAPVMTRYPDTPGRVVSRIFDLEYSGSMVRGIDAVYATPGHSEVYFYYKVAPELFSHDALAGDWIQFSPGSPLPGDATGQYFQLMLELYPSGDRALSPKVSSLEFRYQPDLPPAPPTGVTATAGDGRVTLHWNRVHEYDIGGYLVFYGTRSGTYTGTGGLPGDSPVDAGNSGSIEITNLENGKLYYFTVVAYDNSEPPHRSLFSREVNARPSVVHR